MSEKQYYLVTGTSAREVEQLTGLHGEDTMQGVLIEKPAPFDLDRELARIDRVLHPNRCTCGAWAVFHRYGCPMYDNIT